MNKNENTRYHFSKCSLCFESGPQLKCDRCPTAYHTECAQEKVYHILYKNIQTIMY